MPIRPENKARYPRNWKSEIVPAVRARSGDACEGSPKFPDCRVRNGWIRNNVTGELAAPDDPVSEAWAFADLDSVTRIVLTVGHLDQKPENCALDNLRHWCQRCHLNYDAKQHAQTAYHTRRDGRAAAELFHESDCAARGGNHDFVGSKCIHCGAPSTGARSGMSRTALNPAAAWPFPKGARS